MNRFLLFAFCSIVIFSSCHFFHGERIKGSGNVITQSRNASDFSGVRVSSAIHVYVKQGSAFSVKVETDDNLQQHIIVWQENGVLNIKQEDNTSLDATGKIKVYVSAPEFKSLEASGACTINGQGTLTSTGSLDIHLSGASDAELELKSPKVTVGLTGASNILLAGETKDLSVKGSGSSDINGFELMSETADVDVSGASSADVFASVKIGATASGASSVRYKGNAAIGTKNESGASSINKVE